MNTLKPTLLIIILLCFSFCSVPQIQQVDFLTGTWKMEGKETYESWNQQDNRLVGESYKKRGEQKYVTETLEIKEKDGVLIYTATVKNQNDGKGIPFTLQEVKNSLYSFENLKHDFPKKIQYQIVDESTLKVSVLGEGDKGFSYQLKKVE